MAAFDWTRFEDELTSEFVRALENELAPDLDDSPLYTLALFGVYYELDGCLTLPGLAMNTEKYGPTSKTRSFGDVRWNPPDWHYSCELDGAVQDRLAQELTSEASRSTVQHWRDTEDRYRDVLLRVTAALHDFATKKLRVGEQFVGFLHDSEFGRELAQRTIPAAIFEQIFADDVAQQKAVERLRSGSPEEWVTYLVSRLGKYDGLSTEEADRELVALGEPAVAALVQAVTDSRVGWQAAKILATIGILDRAAIAALRTRIDDNWWFAAALGYLGDWDWLVAHASVEQLVSALTTTLKDWVQVPLDYRRIEAFLDDADEHQREKVAERLKPGSGYLQIVRSDVPEALRGLSSNHAIVRQHAASVLEDRELDDEAGSLVLPALAHALSDIDPNVRRSALFSITLWKGAAKPYLPALRAMRNDADERVRQFAASFVPGDD